ncbi:MAG: hypothetical protein QOE59_1386, partial [Actinomycetota bacterium]|nr:hypothetical protein [Actinomycetota bacterium]
MTIAGRVEGAAAVALNPYLHRGFRHSFPTA